MRVVILGGGYGGLSCLLQLRRQVPEVELHLVDAGTAHIKNNHLHQTLDRPVEDFSLPYATLAERLPCTFHQTRLNWNPDLLRRWQTQRQLDLPTAPLEFDFLVLATGAQPHPLPGGDYCFGLDAFRRGQGPELMEDFRQRVGDRPAHCTVVGSGPSGIQFLFALQEQLNRWRIAAQLRLISLDRQLVAELPESFHDRLLRIFQAKNLQFHPATRYLGQQGTRLQVQSLDGQETHSMESDLTLLFPGVEPFPTRLQTNPRGQVLLDGVVLDRIFAAGDCAAFAGAGLNSLTAQAAVRKGRLVATNLAALVRGQALRAYSYRERGFFLALGPFDGLGWLGWRGNLVGGLAGMAVKELLEAQYDLLLEGLDTYPG